MQDPLFPSTFTRKLYTERAILIGTFIGGPLAGGYLLARNFSALDERNHVASTWLVAILLVVLTMSTAFIPEMDKVPGIVYSFIFCTIAHTAARKLQGGRIQLHLENGGGIYNTWKAVLVGVIFLLLMVAAILGIFYMQDSSAYN